MSNATPAPAQEAESPAKSKIIGGARFVSTYLVANAGLYAIYQGTQSILLPSQVLAIDDANKVAALGVLASIGAIASTIGNPLFGALSDRTRTRFGRRAPWLVVAAIVLSLLLALLGGMTELFWLGAAYVGVMLAASGYQAVITSLLPERVPVARRGLISSLMALATVVGILYGINITPAFADQPTIGYLFLAGLIIVGTAALVILAPEPPLEKILASDSSPKEKQSFREFFSGLADRDFAWAFWARVTIMVGFWTVSTYQLFALSDYIGVDQLPGGDPAAAAALLGTVNLGTSIISTLIAGPLSDKLGRRKIFVIISSIGIGVGMTIPIFIPTFSGMLLWAVVVGFSYGVYTSIDQALMSEVLPNMANAGRDLGLLNVATAGPQIAAPAIAALIISLTGGYQQLFLFAAVVAGLAAVFILPIRKVR
jgi:MFS family permease